MTKYKFDPESLDYKQVGGSARTRIVKQLVIQLLSAVFIALIMFFLISYFIETPDVRRQKREIKQLEAHLKELSLRYEQTIRVLEDIQQRDDNIYKTIFETAPVPDSLRQAIKFSTRYAHLISQDVYDVVEETAERLKKIKWHSNMQEVEARDLQRLISDYQGKISNIPAIMPLYDPEMKYMPYGFGQRIDPIYKTPSFHEGIDFAAPKGTSVVCTADGVVESSGENSRRHGTFVKIDHKNGYKTTYSHLNEIKVRNGQTIKRGELVGTVGNTGKSLVSHLHYEVRVKNEAVNPVNFFFLDLKPAQYQQIINLTSRGGLSLD